MCFILHTLPLPVYKNILFFADQVYLLGGANGVIQPMHMRDRREYDL